MEFDDFHRLLKQDAFLNAAFSDIDFIGLGSQGGVVRATYKQGLPRKDCVCGDKFALKLISRSVLVNDVQGTKRKELEREVINNTTLLVHPHIATYKFSFLTAPFMVLVLEYVENRLADNGVMSMKSVLDHETRLGYLEAKRYFQQLVLAVDYSHQRGVAHRDLKPEHCLLFGFGEDVRDRYGTLKICDWGLSIGDYSLSPKSRVGTPGYWAPEVIVSSWDQSSYDAMAADCYSVGVIFCNFLFGAEVFPCDVEGDRKLLEIGDGYSLYWNAKRRVEQGGSLCHRSLPRKVSDGCFEVLQGLLEVDVEKRWTMADVVNTDWFQRDLPPDAVGMNERRLGTQVSNIAKIRQEIKQLIAQACTL